MRKKVSVSILVILCLFLALLALMPGCKREEAIARGPQTKCYSTSGGDKWVCVSGGEIEMRTGSTLDVQSGATAGIDTLTVGDTLDVNGDIDLDGDGFDINITAGGSIDTDGATNVSASAGDITIDAEAGSLVLIGSEAAADSITLDANDTMTSGLNIDVGSVSGMTIDGGMVDIGGCSAGTADGDNDLCVQGVLEVDGEFELDGALDADSTANVQGLLTLQAGLTTSDGDVVVADDVRVTAQTAITVTDGTPFAATGTYQAIQAAGEVTPTITVGTAGDVLVLINTSAQTINIADTGIQMLTADFAMGQYDTLTLLCDGTNWLELSRADN